jgi:hypothetical protein
VLVEQRERFHVRVHDWAERRLPGAFRYEDPNSNAIVAPFQNTFVPLRRIEASRSCSNPAG